MPKGCSGDGGSLARSAICDESMAMGEPSVWGTQRSAVIATMAMNTIQTAPMTASLFLRRRPKASPQRVRAELSLSTSSTTAL